jgi:hypothetical protein
VGASKEKSAVESHRFASESTPADAAKSHIQADNSTLSAAPTLMHRTLSEFTRTYGDEAIAARTESFWKRISQDLAAKNLSVPADPVIVPQRIRRGPKRVSAKTAEMAVKLAPFLLPTFRPTIPHAPKVATGGNPILPKTAPLLKQSIDFAHHMSTVSQALALVPQSKPTDVKEPKATKRIGDTPVDVQSQGLYCI